MCTSGDPMWTSSCGWNVFLYNFLYCFSYFILIVLLWVHSPGQCVQSKWRKMTRKGNDSITKTKIVILAFLGLFFSFIFCRGICYADGKMAYTSLMRDSWYTGLDRLWWSCSGEVLWWFWIRNMGNHGRGWLIGYQPGVQLTSVQNCRLIIFYTVCIFRDLQS